MHFGWTNFVSMSFPASGCTNLSWWRKNISFFLSFAKNNQKSALLVSIRRDIDGCEFGEFFNKTSNLDFWNNKMIS